MLVGKLYSSRLYYYCCMYGKPRAQKHEQVGAAVAVIVDAVAVASACWYSSRS